MVFVVQFYPWLNFHFPLFWGLEMYDSEIKRKENKIQQRTKLNHNINIV